MWNHKHKNNVVKKLHKYTASQLTNNLKNLMTTKYLNTLGYILNPKNKLNVFFIIFFDNGHLNETKSNITNKSLG